MVPRLLRVASVLLLLLLVWGRGASAQAEKPGRGRAPRIDLYTMGQGDPVVERFGHAALCVRFDDPRRDRCYNYGTTDFTKPLQMGWGFIRGRSRFWVSVSRLDRMIDAYIRSDRTLWLQELPLSDEAAWEMADKLRFDAKEENRYYHYHHFFDNCTTRVRDHIDAALDGALSKGADRSIGVSFREYSREGFADVQWLLAASDLVLGRGADRDATVYEAMFLPDILREEVTRSLGVEPVVVYERQGPGFGKRPAPVRLLFLLLALLLAVPLLLGYRKGRASAWHALIPMGALSFLGLLLWGLSVLSPLYEARYNENLLLFVPFDLALLWMGPRWRRRYATGRVAVVLLALLLWAVGVFHQPLWALAPLPLLSLGIVAAYEDEGC